jgi:hypothetical protein
MEDMTTHIWGGTTETLMHPIAAAALIIASILILVLERDKAFAVFALAAILIPVTQRGNLMGLNFMAFRVLITAVWVRLFFRMELYPLRLNTIDKIFILWVLSNMIAFVLLWQTWGAFVNRLGFMLDSAGIYFLCRFLITDRREIDTAIKAFAVLGIILAGIMFLEQVTGRKALAFMGGIQEMIEVREGRFRSLGPFAHPILAGSFGAALFPLLLSLWRRPNMQTSFLIAGMVAAVMITILSVSSGPILSLIFGIIALYMWPFRGHLPKIKWGIVVTLFTLHLVMKAPVWALIDRVGIIAGSSSYHRFNLVDQFIRRFDEWWLLGTKGTSHWGWMMWDAINQFVAEGIRGGLASLILFIVLLSLCYRTIGVKIAEAGNNRPAQLTLWAIGSALFAHTISFFGIAYFDQSVVFWYFTLAMISTMNNMPISEIYPVANVVAHAKFKRGENAAWISPLS